MEHFVVVNANFFKVWRLDAFKKFSRLNLFKWETDLCYRQQSLPMGHWLPVTPSTCLGVTLATNSYDNRYPLDGDTRYPATLP